MVQKLPAGQDELIKTINDLIPKASDNLQTTAREAVKHASDVKAHAHEAVRLFDQGRTKVDGLLIDYENAVTKVDGQTRMAAISTDQSLANLKGQLATLKTSLNDWISPISPASNGTKSTNSGKKSVNTFLDDFSKAVSKKQALADNDPKLKEQLDSLTAQLDLISQHLASIETASSELASMPVINYDPCISALTAVTSAPVELQVSPLTLEVKQGQTSTLTIAGGVGPYSPSIIGGIGTLPTFSPSTSKGQVTKIDVVTTSSTTPGQYRAVITDSSPSQQSKIIQITVIKAP